MALPKESTTAVITMIRPNHGCPGTVVEIIGRGFGATQPADLDLCFTAYAGGLLTVVVPPSDWSDTLIRATVPKGVGNGPVSFIRRGNPSYSGDTITSATEQLAGAMESCLGMGASRVAFGLRQIATKLGAPIVSSTGQNHFSGGPPKILSFTGNNATQVLLRPRGPLVVVWNTDNADTVEIKTSGPRELPVIGGPLPLSGEERYPSVNGTSNWKGTYTLTATNACGAVTAQLSLEMKERLALTLAGGGSKGAFEVGAVRCLTDIFNYKPDIICGTSVGALNAAKLAEGPAALPELEKLWLGMVSTDDLYVPTGWVISIVKNLAALGIKSAGTVNFATLLGVKGGSYNWLSPDQEIALGVGKNVLGNMSGASWAFTGSDLIFGAIKAGLHLGKVVDGFKGLLRSQSLFVFDPVRMKIDAAIDPAKVQKSGIHLRIAMVNLDSGQTRYVDQRGRFVDDDFPVPLRDAVQASASIPIAYPPTILDEGFSTPVVGPTAQPKGNYIDGGVRDNAPLRAADEAGASSIIAILPSPSAMNRVNFTGMPLPALAARGFEALFDEILQNDLAPFRGYNVPVKLIAPQIEVHGMLTVDQGLIRINMDYGYMRAFDEMQPDDTLRAQFRQLSLDIAKKRLEVWGPMEHYSEGFLMEDEKVSYAAVGLKRTPSSGSLLDVRVGKKAIRALCQQRQTLAKSAGANPAGIERVWQQWEGHDWGPTLVDPWRASYAHVGPAVPAETPPAALPPP
jgi:predicted acylesterase/phospholipase RssA